MPKFTCISFPKVGRYKIQFFGNFKLFQLNDLEHGIQTELPYTFGLTFDLHVVSTGAGKKVNV